MRGERKNNFCANRPASEKIRPPEPKKKKNAGKNCSAGEKKKKVRVYEKVALLPPTPNVERKKKILSFQPRKRKKEKSRTIETMAEVPSSVARALRRVEKFRKVPEDWKNNSSPSGKHFKVEVRCHPFGPNDAEGSGCGGAPKPEMQMVLERRGWLATSPRARRLEFLSVRCLCFQPLPSWAFGRTGFERGRGRRVL